MNYIIKTAGSLTATERLIRMYCSCVSFSKYQRNLGFIFHTQLTIDLKQQIRILHDVSELITAQLSLQ